MNKAEFNELIQKQKNGKLSEYANCGIAELKEDLTQRLFISIYELEQQSKQLESNISRLQDDINRLVLIML